MDESIARGSTGPHESSLPVAVVEAIAAKADVEPTELDLPLYDAIDPDALDHLFPTDEEGRPATRGHLTFSYADFVVRITSDRRVRVFGPGEDGPGAFGTEGS